KPRRRIAKWTRGAARSRDLAVSAARPESEPNLLMWSSTNSGAPRMACSSDRFAATYVVAPDLGPPDCKVADFTDIQSAVNALPASGGKIFVKAGDYVISDTIKLLTSNVHLQGEGMGVTNIIASATMTDRPAIEVYDQRIRYDVALAADTARGDM